MRKPAPIPFGSTAAAAISATPLDPGGADPPAGEADLPFDLPEDGRYRDPMLLGSGAMGRVDAVYDARLGRVVAMKTVRAAVAQATTTQRFVREATLTAGLDHPGIVSVYDAGRRPDGRIFYTMHLVSGRSLAEVLAETPASERLSLLLGPFHRACEAVAYAHERRVIHRDLKPSNIMLSDFGRVQVVDWGLARGIAASPSDAFPDERSSPSPSPEPSTADLTTVGAVIGTPAYMSPEQARGEPATAATDVWALGAILYELVAGGRWVDRRSSASDAVVAPADTPAELGAILSRALAVEPGARYPSAKDLAADVGHYLDGRRVGAHTYSTWQLVKRLVAAWRAPLLVALVALVALGAVGVVSYRSTVEERDRAQQAERAAQTAAAETRRTLGASLGERAVAKLGDGSNAEAQLLALEALARDPGLVLARGVAAAVPAEPALTLLHTAQLPRDCASPAVSPSGDRVACLHPESVTVWAIDPFAHVLTYPVERPDEVVFHEGVDAITINALTGFNTSYRHNEGYVVSLRDGSPLGLLKSSGTSLAATDVSVIQNYSLAAGYVSLVEAMPAQHLEVLAGCRSFGPTGRLIVGRATDDAIALCSTARYLRSRGGYEIDAGPLPMHLEAAPTAGVVVRSDLAIVGDVLGGVTALNPETGAASRRVVVAPGLIDTIDVTDDGAWAMIHGDRVGNVLWDVPRWSAYERLPAAYGDRAALSRDGRWVTVVDDARLLRRFAFDAGPRQRVAGLVGRTGATVTAAGDTLLATGAGLWISPLEGPQPGRVDSERTLLKSGDLSVDGTRYYAATLDSGVLAWSTEGWRARGDVMAGHDTRAYRRVAALADGWVVGCCATPGLRLVRDEGDPTGTHLSEEVETHFVDVDASVDGRVAFAVDIEGTVLRLDQPPAAPRPTITAVGQRRGARVVAATRAGDVLVVDGAGVGLYDGGDLRELRAIDVGSRLVLDLTVSPDDQLLALSERDGDASVWRVATGALVAELRGHTERTPGVDFSRDGRWLVTASWDRTARRWDVATMTADPDELAARLAALARASDLGLVDLAR